MTIESINNLGGDIIIKYVMRLVPSEVDGRQVVPERSEGMDKGGKFLSPPRVLLSYQRRELEALSHVIKEMKSEEEEQVGRRMDLLSSQLGQGQTGMARSLDELSAQLDKNFKMKEQVIKNMFSPKLSHH